VSCKILPRGKGQPSVKLIPHIWHVLKSRMQLALSLLGIYHNGFVLSHPAKLSHSPERSVQWFRYTHCLVSQTMRLAVFSCQWTVKSGANRLPISMVFRNQHFDLASGPYTCWTSTRCEFLRNHLLSWLSISIMFHCSATEYRDSRTARE
jgi:hypothetical protein